MTKLYGLLLVLWLSSSVAVYASTPDSLRQRLSYVFQPLDKSQVPTGCLEEYVAPLQSVYSGGYKKSIADIAWMRWASTFVGVVLSV